MILKKDENPHLRRGVCQELVSISHKLILTNPEVVKKIPIFWCICEMGKDITKKLEINEGAITA